MLSAEENELLTRTGPGTPAGDLFRRYWQPAALSEELPIGAAPLPIRLLGEDLVLFRTDGDRGTPSPHPLPEGEGNALSPDHSALSSTVGCLGLHCSHRGADLSYGRLEDGGLRCIYHGWLYDRQGRCLEQPGEPAFRWTDSGDRDPVRSSGSAAQPEVRSTFHEKIRHPAYPCVERAGVIFAYLGPGEPPLLPNYAMFTVPEENASASKLLSVCNYLQGNEGNIDLLHTSFLHFFKREMSNLSAQERRAAQERYAAPDSLDGRGPSPGLENCEAELVSGGLRICKTRRADQDVYVRLATYLLPSLTVIPGGSINWHVPIDDTHHWKYTLTFNPDGPMPRRRTDGNDWAPPPTYEPVPKAANRYLQDRELMRTTGYCGIPQVYFAAQDLCATEGAGPIQDRAQEHLVGTDAPLVAARHLLRRAIQDVQEGRDPPHVIRDPDLNDMREVMGTFGMLPRGLSWKEYCRQLAAEGKGWQSRQAR